MNLRMELGRRQSDVQRSSEEKAENDRVMSQLREDLISVKAEVRELENDKIRLEAETNRLTEALTEAKNLVQSRDADLRASLASFNEIQRSHTEEKTDMRIEIK